MSYESIGLTATLFVLLSFLMQSVRMIRIINIIGAILFVIYGYLIGSVSTAVLNAALIVIHAVYLIRGNKTKEK